MKNIKWILLAVAVIAILCGSYFAGKMVTQSSAPHTAQTNSSNSATESSSVSYSSSASPSVSNDQLDYETITPMQTAAAIAYYGQHEVGKQLWKHLFDGSSDLDIYQNDNADGLNVKGRGNSWMLHPSGENGGHMATYTVGADGTVAFYDVAPSNQDKDKDPYTTVNLHDIINYVNEHHAVEQVKDKAQHIHLQH